MNFTWTFKTSKKYRERRFSDKFDRKADYGERHGMVESLRRRGWTRRLELARRERQNDWQYPNKWYGVESTAMSELMFMPTKGKTFLDIGCGYSPDAYIALKKGYKKAWRLDLYTTPLWSSDAELLIADYCEHIPLPDNSVDVVVASATLNLNKRIDRNLAYKQVKRVLKKDGLFSIYACSLLNAHEFELRDEITILHGMGFAIVQKFNGGAILQLTRKRMPVSNKKEQSARTRSKEV